MKKLAKTMTTLIATLLMTLMLATSASALTLAPDVAQTTENPQPSISESSDRGDQTSTTDTESEPNGGEPSGEFGVSCGDRLDDVDVPVPVEDPVEPDVEPRNWLAEQIRLQPYAYGLSSDGTLYVDMELTDATKIIFIVDRVCPTWYDEDGSLWLSGFNIPCGINMQMYRFLEMVDRISTLYEEDGVGRLMELYSSEELAEMYATLCELAPASYSKLIEWLDSYSVCITMTNPTTVVTPENTEPITGPATDWPIDEPCKNELFFEDTLEDWPM